MRMVLLVSLHVIIDAQISPIQSRRTSCRHPGAGASWDRAARLRPASGRTHTKLRGEFKDEAPFVRAH